MPLQSFSIEQLRELNISKLMAMAEKITDEYVKLINEIPVTEEAARCRELIIRVHNVIDEKIDKGEV